MGLIFFWILVFSLTTTASIVLLGQRDLISGNLLSFSSLIKLIIDPRFIISMACALIARFAFIMTNNNLLKIPHLADSSTTITTFITLFSLILVVAANVVFLKEKIILDQGIGAALIMIGIWVMLK